MLASPDALPTPSITERLGGRWALSLVGYLVCCGCIFVLVFASEESATASWRNAGAWAVCCLAASAVFGVYLVALNHLTPYRFRRERPIPAWLAVLGAVLGATIVGLTTWWMATMLGLDITLAFWPRLVAIAVLGSVLGLAILLLLERIDRSRRNLDILIESQVSNELASISQAMLLQEMRDALMDEIDAELDASREQVQQRLHEVQTSSDLESLRLISDELRDMADGSIRPLSARLWSSAARSQPRASWWSLFAETMRNEPFHPVALVAVHVFGTTAALIGQFGTTAALAMTGASAVLIVCITLIANAFMRAHPAHHALIFMLGVITLQVFVVPTALWRDSLVPGSGSPSWVVTQIIAGVIVIFAISGVGSIWRIQDALAEERRRILSTDRARAVARSRIIADLARETSQVLHGSVQTRLVACAMSSERAIAHDDRELLTEALVEASRILQQESLKQAPVSSLRSEIDRKVQLWVELCDITLTVDPLLLELDAQTGVSGATASTVGRVIEEAMSNAIRHGDANSIAVDVAQMPDASIQVIVTDNGSGVAANPPGMGSAFLTQATQGSWSLVDIGEGARLTACVPTAATSP